MIGSEIIQSGYRYALSLAHDPHAAEDLVQEACLKLFDKFGEIGKKSLLFVTIRNLFIDKYRRSKIVQFESMEDEGKYASPDDDFERDCTIQELEKALEELRPEEREVIYLHYYEGYSAQEIGEIVTRPRNTVLSLLARGRKKLAEILQGYAADAEAAPQGAED